MCSAAARTRGTADLGEPPSEGVAGRSSSVQIPYVGCTTARGVSIGSCYVESAMLNTDRLGLLGRTIDGRYTINAVIGEGGVGAVYRAEHNRLGRTVAIKVLHQQFSRDPEALERGATWIQSVITKRSTP